MKVSNSVENRNLDRVESAKTRKTDEAKTKKPGESATAEAASPNPNVKAEISGQAKEMATAKAVALQAPDVREDRVAELKKKIQNKEYKVSPEAIADKLLKEHLETKGQG